MTWDFTPFSLRGVDSNHTDFPERFQIQIIIFFKIFVTDWNICPDSTYTTLIFLNFLFQVGIKKKY